MSMVNQSVMLIEEEAVIEDEEESKKSDFVNLEAASLQSTPIKKSYSKENTESNGMRQSSKYNLLASFQSDFKTKNSKLESNSEPIQHSDDEVDIRRGLEPSSGRTDNPREPELLR